MIYYILFSVMLRIATLNVNGLRNDQKREILFNHLNREKYDIICLQETHSTREDEGSWTKQWGGEMAFNHGESNSKGVAILASRKSEIKLENLDKDDEGRLITCDILWNNTPISILNIYAPNQMYNRKTFFQNLNKYLYEGENWLIAGDFNCHLDYDNNIDKSVIELKNLITNHDIIDIYRNLYPDDLGYTFYHRGFKKSSRLDYMFISRSLYCLLSNASVSSIGLSDHFAVISRFEKRDINLGPGRWICNNQLLRDEQCAQRIKYFWYYWKTQKYNYGNLLEWWDHGKCKLKEIIKNVGSEKYNKEKRYKNELQNNLTRLINDPHSDPNVISEIENKIKAYEFEDLEKFRVRCHINKITGEKPTNFFSRMEKQRNKDNILTNLVDGDGKFYADTFSMCEYANSFYENLYTSEGISNDNYGTILDNVNFVSFDDDVIDDLEKDLDENDLSFALNHMKRDKSPGLDGLTVEFYQLFWPVIKFEFIEVANECLKSDRLPDSMNIALIRLIFKNRGERNNLKNWRPISLLNVDYKIISKVITNKLKKIMPLIIGDDQSCGVAGRNIHDNLMTLRDSIYYINNEGKQGALLSIDQEKAFDRIEWVYMFGIMNKMGIPNGLIRWVRTLYSNPSSSIIINNFLTEPFGVTRGIRQGCPLSPLLYTICAEGLACLIRNNNNIKGFVLPDSSQTLNLIQHADDTTIFLTNNNDFDVLDEVFTVYSRGSGSKINVGKSQGLWLGKWKDRKDKPGGFSWVNDHLKILGIYFGNDDNSARNWEPRISKMEKTFNMWKTRDLTLKGKSIVINSFFGAGLSYFGSVLDCPEVYISKMEKIKWSFFWNGKPDKIKRSVICGPSENGGTGVIDVKRKLQALKINTLRKFRESSGKWKPLFSYCISQASGESQLDWYVFNSPKAIVPTAQPYYKDLIVNFNKSGAIIDTSFSCVNETGNLPLWNNTIITGNQEKALDSNILKPRGIIHLKDITQDGQLFSFKKIADSCAILPINAGRIMAGLNRNIKKDYINESREGPPNHFLNKVTFNNKDTVIDLTNINVKVIYNILISRNLITPTAQEEWNFFFKVSNINWNQIWLQNKYEFMDVCDKDIWFKLKHRILPTKDKLERWGITDDNLCPLCKASKETIEHLFINCTKHTNAWFFVENIIKKYNKDMTFTLSDICRILGVGLKKDICLLLISRLHRTIWKIRCKLTDQSNNYNLDILRTYQCSLRKFILLEKLRLPDNVFRFIYNRNSALCFFEGDNLRFCF